MQSSVLAADVSGSDPASSPSDGFGWVREAESLGERILGEAYRGRGDRLLWLRPGLTGEKAKSLGAAALLGSDLNTGTTGIALFLAALARQTGASEPADACRRIVAPLREQLDRLTKMPQALLGAHPRLGLLVGLGGYVYALSLMGRWLDDHELRREAMEATGLFTEEVVAEDRFLDVAEGSAGALLAVLAVADHEGESGDDVLVRARVLGDHLIRHQVRHREALHDGPDAHSAGGWPWAGSGTALCGFAHGAGGISHALLELHRAVGDEVYRQAAFDGLSFEDRHFETTVGNWRDLRPGDGPDFRVAWCHGAPGIALTRLAGTDLLPPEAGRRPAAVALATTRDWVLEDLDHVCCGNFGRIETLLVGGRELGEPGWVEAARELAGVAVGRARERGYYGWPETPGPDHFDPSFWNGAAGVGYTLLRLAEPSAWPSILSAGGAGKGPSGQEKSENLA